MLYKLHRLIFSFSETKHTSLVKKIRFFNSTIKLIYLTLRLVIYNMNGLFKYNHEKQ